MLCDSNQLVTIFVFQNGFSFSPVLEPVYSSAFIVENMYSAVENGRSNRVPLIIGFCSEELLMSAGSK